MAKSSHMDAINRLPRWDASAPTKYNYDPTAPYDRADYAAFKQARLDKNPIKSSAKATKTFDLKQVIRDTLAAVEKEVAKPKQKKHKGKELVADQDSSVFADLRWQDGLAVATFYRGGVYEYPMSRADFKEWKNSDSLGSYFNAVIR